jgi:hypothetical protein
MASFCQDYKMSLFLPAAGSEDTYMAVTEAVQQILPDVTVLPAPLQALLDQASSVPDPPTAGAAGATGGFWALVLV